MVVSVDSKLGKSAMSGARGQNEKGGKKGDLEVIFFGMFLGIFLYYGWCGVIVEGCLVSVWSM